MIWHPFIGGFLTAMALVDYSTGSWKAFAIDVMLAATAMILSYRAVRRSEDSGKP